MSLHQMEQALTTTSTGTERSIRDVRMMRSSGRWVQPDITRRSIPMRGMQTQSALNCAASAMETAQAQTIRSGI